jgi:hypothetical protein
MSNESPASILFDENGNPVGVIFDGTIYRLQTQDIIVDGYGNGPVSVTPPFTPATTADPALVVAISPNNSFTVTELKSSISITSSVAASVTNVNILPSNSNRLGATIYNDSSALLYVKLGAVASTSDYTIKMFPLSYFECPYNYTGQIDAIWSIAFGSVSGFARVDEFAP